MISKETSEHYIWGGDCDGWHLVGREELSVTLERMPPGRSEARHHHEDSRQFFFVLSGVLTLEIAGKKETITSGKGLEISPLEDHQAINDSEKPVEFLVVSQPSTENDRVLSG